jgi:hypothetical protein
MLSISETNALPIAIGTIEANGQIQTEVLMFPLEGKAGLLKQ